MTAGPRGVGLTGSETVLAAEDASMALGVTTVLLTLIVSVVETLLAMVDVVEGSVAGIASSVLVALAIFMDAIHLFNLEYVHVTRS